MQGIRAALASQAGAGPPTAAAPPASASAVSLFKAPDAAKVRRISQLLLHLLTFAAVASGNAREASRAAA
jgi:hypothetical protein